MRLSRILVLLTAVLLLAALPAPAGNAPSQPAAVGAANEALVRFLPQATASQRQAVRAALGPTVTAAGWRPIGDGSLVRVRSATLSTEQLLARVSGLAGVQYAEPNYRIRIARTPNDPDFGLLWGLENLGQTVHGRSGTAGADIRAAKAWDVSTGTEDAVVGILDTGLDYTHPDLAANVWSSPWSFPVTIGGVTRTCPEGSRGYNALADSFDPLDDNDHGTHCAGTIGAVGDNGVGVTGVNWSASLLGLKVLDAAGNGTAADAINALEFAIQARHVLHWSANIRVLSASWTVAGPSQALREQLEKAGRNELLVVAAAGNGGANLDVAPAYPASYGLPNVLAVAATGMTDHLTAASNYGAATVPLAAPGENVVSTVRNGEYATLDGTSMAAAHTAGVAALMLAVDRGLSVEQLRAGLVAGVDPLPALQSVVGSGGRLNANAAVRALGPRLDYRINLFSPPHASVIAGESARFDVLVSTTQSYPGDVMLQFEGLPPGATSVPQNLGGGGMASVSVDTTTATPPGNYLLTLRGTGGELSHSFTINLEVRPAPEFTLSVTPDTRSVKGGGRVHYQVRLTPGGASTGPVTLSVSGLEAGTRAVFSRPRLGGGARSARLTVLTSRNTSPGYHTLEVRGTRGEASSTVPVTLLVRGRR